MHAKHIIHRDLKSNNIFLHDDNFTVKIGDFGLATVKQKWKDSQQVKQPTGMYIAFPNQNLPLYFKEREKKLKNCQYLQKIFFPGSIYWMAPEIIKIKTEDAYSPRSDVYAFGIVLYELLAGILPYSDGGARATDGTRFSPRAIGPDVIMWLVGTGQLIPNKDAIKQETPKSLRRLLDSCIDHDREKRPEFTHILAQVEHIMTNIPKISRSNSEPILQRTTFNTDVGGYSEDNSTPKTPAHLL